ncbi:MAG: OmpA family protein [Bacteroidales bacterium]
MHLKLLFLLLTLTFLSALSGALQAQVNQADELIKKGDFKEALILLESARAKGFTDPASSVNLLYCYIRLHEYNRADELYSEILKQKNINPLLFFYRGEWFKSTKKYQEAKSFYNKYLEFVPGDYYTLNCLRSCDSLEVWEQFSNTIICNNEPDINSSFNESWPVPGDNEFQFISDNPDLAQKTGNYSSLKYPDMSYLFMKKNGEIACIRPLGDSVSYLSFSQRGKNTAISVKEIVKSRDAYLRGATSIKISRGSPAWDDFLPEGFSGNYSIIHPSFSGNGLRVFYACNDPGGYGGFDLYYSDWKDSKWSEPVNLGNVINTPGNELFPYITDNGNILYFSSDGHPGYGNLDVFSSVLSQQSWSIPANVRSPINSGGNDFGLIYSTDPDKGYFVSDRYLNAKGGTDIYSFQFPQPEIIVEPVPVEEPPKEPEKIVFEPDTSYIFFRTSLTRIDTMFEESLDSILRLLKEKPALILNIVAWADFRGSERKNKNLSIDRAIAVSDWFTSRGIDSKRVVRSPSGEANKIPAPGRFLYHVQIGHGKRKDGLQYFNHKLNRQLPVSFCRRGKGTYYYTGKGTFEEMQSLAAEIKLKYKIDAFISVSYNHYYLPDMRFAPCRRADLFFTGIE